jgi:hypothetical protein
MTQFILEVRRLGGFETTDEANSFVTDAEIESRGNANLRKVYLALVRARGANYYRASWDFQTQVGVSTYTMMVQILEAISMSRQINGTWTPMFDFQESERHDFDEWPFIAFGDISRLHCATRFQLRGGNLEIAPTPESVDTLRLNYIPSYTNITKAGGETFDGVAGFQEWAIWETVAEFQQKDSADWQLSMLKAGWWEKEVESMARQRLSAARRVNRVRRRKRFPW